MTKTGKKVIVIVILQKWIESADTKEVESSGHGGIELKEVEMITKFCAWLIVRLVINH